MRYSHQQRWERIETPQTHEMGAICTVTPTNNGGSGLKLVRGTHGTEYEFVTPTNNGGSGLKHADQ